MAGYSGTPLAQKLNIKDGTRLALISEPGNFGETLGDMPGIVELSRGDERADVIVCFVEGLAEVEERLDFAERLLTRGGEVDQISGGAQR